MNFDATIVDTVVTFTWDPPAESNECCGRDKSWTVRGIVVVYRLQTQQDKVLLLVQV